MLTIAAASSSIARFSRAVSNTKRCLVYASIVARHAYIASRQLPLSAAGPDAASTLLTAASVASMLALSITAQKAEKRSASGGLQTNA